MALLDSTKQQGHVLEEAIQIFNERNTKYGDLWKQYGALDNMHHMKSKLLRIMNGMQSDVDSGELYIDDALDLINYTVFFIRNVRDGRIAGASL